MVSKSEVINMTAKMGRPTDSPKTVQLGIRFDRETLNILDNYCKKENISRAEGVRKAVRLLPHKK